MSTADERSALLLKRKKLKESLRRLRVDIANKNDMSPLQVFQNATLADIVIAMPKSKVELLCIKSLGPKKTEMYGDAILQAVEAYRQEQSRPKYVATGSPTAVVPCDQEAPTTPVSRLYQAGKEETQLSPLLGAKFV